MARLRTRGLQDAKRRMDERAARTRNLKRPLSAGAEALRKLMDDSFQLSRSPSGESWRPLKPASILARKSVQSKRGKKRIAKGLEQFGVGSAKPLVDTGRLRNSVFARAKRDRIEFGTNVPYGAPHQFVDKKNRRLPRRAFLPVDKTAAGFRLMARGPAAKMVKRLRDKLRRYIIEGRL